MTFRARPHQIAPGVHLLRAGRSAAASNVYLIASGSTWALVDAAWAGSAETITAAAESLFGTGTKPAAILLTHLHPDHSGAAGALARTWGCRCTSTPLSCRWPRAGTCRSTRCRWTGGW